MTSIRPEPTASKAMELGGRYLCGEELQEFPFRHVGKDVKIHSRSSVYEFENISIGDNVRIDDFAIIIATGELCIGNYVSVDNFCYINSKYGVEIGDFVTFAPGVRLFSASDDYHGNKLTGPVVPAELTGGEKGPVVLHKHVLLGSNSIVLPNCRLGEGCSVGAQSLVKSDLQPWSIYAGVPARWIGPRKKDLLNLESECRETALRGSEEVPS